ncbi:MAG TPA: glycosyltransferase [Actinomycetota bacterium]|nr:glycosyltransferase [Actinomycetota bacterium]
MRADLGIDGQPLVVFAGRLEYEKGVQTLIDAVPIVDRAAPGVRVVVAGAGSYRAELERRVRALRLGRRVRFEGFVDERRLRRLYQAADAVVVPSLYEPFGLVAVEAMACRTPVVASDTGGLREVVDHGVTGLRFARGNGRSLAAALRRVLTDPELASRLTDEAAAVLAARPSWDEVADRTARAYGRAVERGPVRA